MIHLRFPLRGQSKARPGLPILLWLLLIIVGGVLSCISEVVLGSKLNIFLVQRASAVAYYGAVIALITIFCATETYRSRRFAGKWNVIMQRGRTDFVIGRYLIFYLLMTLIIGSLFLYSWLSEDVWKGLLVLSWNSGIGASLFGFFKWNSFK